MESFVSSVNVKRLHKQFSSSLSLHSYFVNDRTITVKRDSILKSMNDRSVNTINGVINAR